MVASAYPQLDHLDPTTQEQLWLVRSASVPRLRSMREFAEQEIVIPDGTYKGLRYRVDRQPYTGLWFDAVDSGRWNRFVATGPTQSGKTLSCYVVPTLYHLFEIGETVICGVPKLEMAADKWREDILPVIERSRFRTLLPQSGIGSRGGKIDAIRFTNGATLKFMSGGGSDKARAGFTARVLVITETDGMDEAGGTSREADKITQLEGRTRHYAGRKRVYLECTVSVEAGRTWREYNAGTQSRIVLPCPHCKAWVYPEREHLQGHQAAENEVEAGEKSAFYCPDCGEAWTEKERAAAAGGGKLLHRGQTIEPDGTIAGEPPPTKTLGFRWSAVDNLFVTAADIGVDEWKASQSNDEENAEKEMRQFVWALPHEPSVWDQTPLDIHDISRRTNDMGRGFVPKDAECVSVGIDVGKFKLHWIAVAWRAGATPHVFDYGALGVLSDQMGPEAAILTALLEFRDDVLEQGWETTGGDSRIPDAVWIDAGYMTDVIYEFCRKSPDRYRPMIGRGASQKTRTQRYNRPKTTGAIVVYVGEGYHLSRLKKHGVLLVEVDSDQYKTFVHERLSTPLGESGAWSLFHDPPQKHLQLARHLTAERQIEEFEPGKGTVVKWETVRRENHWLDCAYIASAAGHFAGARLKGHEVKPVQRPTRKRPRLTTPDGRAFLVTER